MSDVDYAALVDALAGRFDEVFGGEWEISGPGGFLRRGARAG